MILQHDKSISSLETWGDLVVLGGTSVGAWDPVHGFNIVNQSNRGLVTSFSVYDNKIAWAGNNDIYISTLVPEPPSLLALVAGLSALGTMRRRRTKEGR